MPKIRNMGSATMRFGEGIIVTGSAHHPDGTESNYSLITSGSLYVTDTAQINTVHVLSNGRMGIGTDAPDFKLDVAGNIGINEKLVHNGDNDTHLSFPNTNTMNLTVGNHSFLKCDGSNILINNANQDRDTKIMAQGGDILFHVDAGDGRVGIRTTTPDHELHIDGTVKMNTMVVKVRDVGSTSTIQDSDYCVRCIQTGAIQLTLPSKSNNAGKVLVIKDALGNAGSHNITLVGHGSGGSQDKIDGPGGTTSYVLNVNHVAVTLICDGINGWMIVGKV